jgi:hypothetical protein
LESTISAAFGVERFACQILIFLDFGLENAKWYRERCKISGFSVEFEDMGRFMVF